MNISKPRLILLLIFAPLILAAIILPILLFDLDIANGITQATVGPLLALVHGLNYWVVRKTASPKELRNLQTSVVAGLGLGAGFFLSGVANMLNVRELHRVGIGVLVLGGAAAVTIYFLNLPERQPALTPLIVLRSVGLGVSVIVLGIAVLIAVGCLAITFLVNVLINAPL